MSNVNDISKKVNFRSLWFFVLIYVLQSKDFAKISYEEKGKGKNHFQNKQLNGKRPRSSKVATQVPGKTVISPQLYHQATTAGSLLFK